MLAKVMTLSIWTDEALSNVLSKVAVHGAVQVLQGDGEVLFTSVHILFVSVCWHSAVLQVQEGAVTNGCNMLQSFLTYFRAKYCALRTEKCWRTKTI